MDDDWLLYAYGAVGVVLAGVVAAAVYLNQQKNKAPQVHVASDMVGGYRLPLAGGSPGMDEPPERIVSQGPYRFTRNPMYLGHLVFLLGLALTFWSWFAVVILVARALWFHRRVLQDEQRLQEIFGAEYTAYQARVKRWIPGIL